MKFFKVIMTHIVNINLVCGFILLSACGSNSSAPENTSSQQLFLNANIYTANSKQPWAKAMYVENGVIKFVGDESGAKAMAVKNTKTTDLAGKMIMPGIQTMTIINRVGMDSKLMRNLTIKAKRNPKRVVFAEADNYKILKAAQEVADEGIAKPILLGDVKKIEAMITQCEQSYSVRDKQDVLAMCALQFASQTEQKSIDKENVNEHVEDKLNALNSLLNKHLNL